MSDVYSLRLPPRQTTPVVVSSPHSGSRYPADFLARIALDAQAIRSSEDAFVDQLFAAAPGLGAPLLAALLPRAMVDLNRAADELDPAVVEGAPRGAHNPRVASGLGVIPRVVAGGRAIYAGKLTLREAETRLRQCWHPYHQTLRALLDQTHIRFGEAVLIDCHSMPHEAIEAHTRPGQPHSEVVLGDRFGAAASRDMMDLVEAAFARTGLRVSRNAPFAGAFITQTYGRPSRRCHAIQIEIDRSLYMDEQRVLPKPSFADVQRQVSAALKEICDALRGDCALAAE